MSQGQMNVPVREGALARDLALATKQLPAGVVDYKQSDATMVVTHILGPHGKLVVHQRNGGTGIPLLFVHADSGRGAQWEPVMSLLTKDRELASFDFRGHGDSGPASDGHYGFDGRAEDIGAVARVLGWSKFIIVTHSAGAAVALTYSSRHSDRVAGLLMVDPPTDPRVLPQAVRDKFVQDLTGAQGLDVQKAYYTSIAGSNSAVVGRVLADTEIVVPAARVGGARALAAWEPELTLNAYKGPMFVLSTQTNDTPAALYRLRPDVPHRIVANSGHWMQLEHPTLVVAVIVEFTAKIDAAEQKQRRYSTLA